MNNLYTHFYNKLVKLTTNKFLYKELKIQDTFSDRLTLFLIHFSFVLKNFKNPNNEKELQKLYDYVFNQLELSIREIGYGDQTINKKMKQYINLFHTIISEIHFWETLNVTKKNEFFSKFLPTFTGYVTLIDYFDDFNDNLSKKTLKLYLKSVIRT